MALVSQNSEMTTTEMAEILGISRRAIAKQITSLKENGKLRRIDSDKGGHWEIVKEFKRIARGIIKKAYVSSFKNRL